MASSDKDRATNGAISARIERRPPLPHTQRRFNSNEGMVPIRVASTLAQPAGIPSSPTATASTVRLVAVATAETEAYLTSFGSRRVSTGQGWPSGLGVAWACSWGRGQRWRAGGPAQDRWPFCPGGRAPRVGARPSSPAGWCRPSTVKLTLDLHDVYNRGDQIDAALRAVIDEAVQKKARTVEIISGKGSGQLKKRVLRFLDQREIKALYHRVEKDSDNFGRVFVHFRWK